MTSAKDIAEWIVEQLEKEQYLYQETVVYDIEDKFGKQFVYINVNGNLAIDRKVLEELRSLIEGTVVWERGQRMWCKREKYDPPEKRLAD